MIWHHSLWLNGRVLWRMKQTNNFQTQRLQKSNCHIETSFKLGPGLIVNLVIDWFISWRRAVPWHLGAWAIPCFLLTLIGKLLLLAEGLQDDLFFRKWLEMAGPPPKPVRFAFLFWTVPCWSMESHVGKSFLPLKDQDRMIVWWVLGKTFLAGARICFVLGRITWLAETQVADQVSRSMAVSAIPNLGSFSIVFPKNPIMIPIHWAYIALNKESGLLRGWASPQKTEPLRLARLQWLLLRFYWPQFDLQWDIG